MKVIRALMSLIVVSALVGCASVPTGPSVLVLQGSGKSFTQFSQDDFYCRDFALRQLGGKSPDQAGRNAGVTSAVAGTAIGAAVGAAVGGSDGAGVGAGTGLLLGSAAGSDAYRYSTQSSQQQYDHAYIQCMYGAGHKVPVPAGLRLSETGSQRLQNQKPPPTSAPPPPPPPAR